MKYDYRVFDGMSKVLVEKAILLPFFSPQFPHILMLVW
jgi:hypothetical protein